MSSSGDEGGASGSASDSVPASPKPQNGPKTYKRVEVPTHEQLMASELMDSCILRFFISGIAGAGLGAAMGLLFGSFSLEMTPGMLEGRERNTISLAQESRSLDR